MAGLHVLQGGEEDFPSEDQVGDHKAQPIDTGGIEWERSSPMMKKAASGEQLRNIVVVFVVAGCRRTAFLPHGSR